MKSIDELLKGFKIPIPPENIIEKIIEDYFFNLKNKKIKVKALIQGKTIFIKTDPYTKREILLKQKELVGLIKEKLTKISINYLR